MCRMDGGGSAEGCAWVPPARDPVFAARYLARDGLCLGAPAMPVPDGLAGMVPGPELGAVLAAVVAS